MANSKKTQGTKRTQSETSNTVKPRKKTQKQSDKQYEEYSSTSFTLDISGILAARMTTTKYNFLFNNELYKDLIIQEIIEEFDKSFIKNNADDVTTDGSQEDDDHILNHRKELGVKLTTHGHMNISDGIQNKRNQCRVVAHPSVKEMYMCVKSQEFNPLFDCGDNAVFAFGGWLVYKCERMKTTGTDSYEVFQTKSKMLGNLTDIKSFHWLALHDKGYCSIRTLDEQAVLVAKDCPSIAKENVEISIIQEHLELSYRTSNWLYITPYSLAKEKGIEPVVKWKDYYSTLTSTMCNNHVNNSTQLSTTSTMLDTYFAPVNNSTQSSTSTIPIDTIVEYLENNVPKQVHYDTVVVEPPILPFVQVSPSVQDYNDCDIEKTLENLLEPLSPVHTVNYMEVSALPVGSSEMPSIQHDEEESSNINSAEKTSFSQDYEELSTLDKHLDTSDALTKSWFEN